MKPLSLLLALALGFSASVQVGCLSADDKDSTSINPFPKPLGPRIIPMEEEATATFHYVELDSAGKVALRVDELTLWIKRRTADVYSYAFEDTGKGLLLRFKDTTVEASGVYIVGSFANSRQVFDSVPVLWLPQRPSLGVTWPLGPNRSTELAASEEPYLTAPIFSDDDKAPMVEGFQRQPAVVFKETAGDTVTFYYFRYGVGCLGFERSVAGRLFATGTITQFYRPRW